jgi:hypothetical protein
MDGQQTRAAQRRAAFAVISRRLKEFYVALMALAFKDAEALIERAQRQTAQNQHDR